MYALAGLRVPGRWVIGEAVKAHDRGIKAAVAVVLGSRDLAHWSALNWEGHWRQRIGVEIMRGVARCAQRSAD
jgi:hypothetical protein